MAKPLQDDDTIDWAPEPSTPPAAQALPWRVLIVDDDPDVHQATVFALSRQHILGRPLEFLNAHSAQAARELLQSHTDIAVILLDVVMESPDAGLELVREIRDQLGLLEVRIILRTGQPGYAPEVEAIRHFDINDYKTKTELTRERLCTTLTTAIRSYEQIRQLSANRRGLRRLVQTSAELLSESSYPGFFDKLLTRIHRLLDHPVTAVLAGPAGSRGPAGPYLLATSSIYRGVLGEPLERLPDRAMGEQIEQCLSRKSHRYGGQSLCLYIESRQHRPLALAIDTRPLQGCDHLPLLELLAGNVAACLDNLVMVERLRESAYMDPLLGLPNRASLTAAIDRLIAEQRTAGICMALVDIDHFSTTNDVLGYRFGDQLLETVAGRLQQAFGTGVTLTRIASDTFGLLGPEQTVSLSALQRCFHSPCRLEHHDLQVSASFGLVRLEDHGEDGEAALKKASIALKRAKEQDRGSGLYFEQRMAVEIRERMELVQALRGALGSDALFLVYQPQLSLTTGQPVGLEALIRWQDPEGNLIPPCRFIPIAEQAGLIVELGEWILRSACREQCELAAAGFPALRVAVNVSVKQFEHPGFLAMLDRVLADTGIDPGRLELEVTESVAALDPARLSGLLTELKNRGITLALDDFGTGFSSLSYLQRLPIDRLKIDRSFTCQLGQEADASIPELVIALGRSLELVIIAEGVEEAAQADRLKVLGCDEVQGFFFARPMTRERLYTWLQNPQSPGETV